jgi:hypothetical protein
MNEELEKQRAAEQGGEANTTNAENGGEKEYTPPNPSDVEAGNHTANPSAAYGTFATPPSSATTTTSSTAVYAPPPPPVESPLNNVQTAPTAPFVPIVTNIDTDID